MITFEQALNKANEYLSGSSQPVVITSIGRFSEGWWFGFDSYKYLETGDNSELLAGNAPFIIDQDNGELYTTGAIRSLDFYLEEYKKKKFNK